MASIRDRHELERALRDYAPEGYSVRIPVLGEGVIEEVIQEYQQRAVYRIGLSTPLKFDDYAKEVGASTTKMDAEQVRALWRGHDPPFTLEQMERGMSRQDILRYNMVSTGCLALDGTIVCSMAEWKDVEITELRRGMLVEYEEGHGGETPGGGTGGVRVWAGRIVGSVAASKNPEGSWPVALINLFDPVTYYRTPQGVNNLLIKKGYYSEQVWAIDYGLYEAIEMGAPELLPKKGKWTDDKKEFYLDEPVPVQVFKDFCDQTYPDEPRCFLQALMIYILPVNVGERGVFRPLRRGDIDDYVAAVQATVDI